MRAVDLEKQEPLSATDAVAFVTALLASQFIAVHVVCELPKKSGATGIAGPRSLMMYHEINASHFFPKESDNFVEVQQCPSEVHKIL